MTQANIHLRKAALPDAAILAELFDIASGGEVARAYAARAGTGQSWIEPASGEVAIEIADPLSELIVAEVDGEVAGFMALNWFGSGGELPAPEGMDAKERAIRALVARLGEHLLVRDLAVLPRFRRAGIGSALLLLARACADSNGIAAVATVARRGNEEMPRLLASNRFGPVEVDVSDYACFAQIADLGCRAAA